MGLTTVVRPYIIITSYMCHDSRNGVDNGSEAIDHDDQTHNGRREQPGSVEAKPREVDANLLTKVAPA